MATQKQLKDFVIKLRKKARELELEQMFCNKRGFTLESQVFDQKIRILNDVIHDMERTFDLGFVWDDSLN